MEEIWKTIEGFESYQVSNLGNVKSFYKSKNGILLSLFESNNNYLSVTLRGVNKNVKQFSIHALVANAFVENPNNKPCIDHIDQNKHNNCADNLRWATKSNNAMNVPKRGGSSKYKGVYWNKSRNKWQSKIQVMYQTIHLGRFDTEEEAGRAYDAYIIQHLADFGILNFPV
jgi:hypothetical protein